MNNSNSCQIAQSPQILSLKKDVNRKSTTRKSKSSEKIENGENMESNTTLSTRSSSSFYGSAEKRRSNKSSTLSEINCNKAVTKLTPKKSVCIKSPPSKKSPAKKQSTKTPKARRSSVKKVYDFFESTPQDNSKIIKKPVKKQAKVSSKPIWTALSSSKKQNQRHNLWSSQKENRRPKIDSRKSVWDTRVLKPSKCASSEGTFLSVSDAGSVTDIPSTITSSISVTDIPSTITSPISVTDIPSTITSPISSPPAACSLVS